MLKWFNVGLVQYKLNMEISLVSHEKSNKPIENKLNQSTFYISTKKVKHQFLAGFLQGN